MSFSHLGKAYSAGSDGASNPHSTGSLLKPAALAQGSRGHQKIESIRGAGVDALGGAMSQGGKRAV
jgi:hypothetical protein